MNMTGFECVACGERQDADYGGYVCPTCGNNLQVTYDYDAVRQALDRDRPFAHDRGDIFRYQQLLPIDDVSLAPPLRIGSTPLYGAPRLGASIGHENLWLKDEGLNPSASVKDRANAQTSCAGQFIYSHIQDLNVPWLHIDLAGPAFPAKRATGFGVALISEVVRSFKPSDLKR